MLKQIELIQKGNFWRNPIRSIMTTNVKTIGPEELKKAPKLMADFNIRHLPIVTKSKGRTHVIGVLSMRDLFRLMMEENEYQIEKILNPSPPVAAKKAKKKLLGFFTSDDQLKMLMEKAGKLTKSLIVHAGKFQSSRNVYELTEDFEAVCIDLDPLNEFDALQAMAAAREMAKRIRVMIVFQPANLTKKTQEELHKIHLQKSVTLLSKPVAFGLLYEHFLKGF